MQELTEDMFKIGLKIEIDDGNKVQVFRVEEIIPMRSWDESLKRMMPAYDTEILIDKKKNSYFSLKSYNEQKSWVKKISFKHD